MNCVKFHRKKYIKKSGHFINLQNVKRYFRKKASFEKILLKSMATTFFSIYAQYFIQNSTNVYKEILFLRKQF